MVVAHRFAPSTRALVVAVAIVAATALALPGSVAAPASVTPSLLAPSPPAPTSGPVLVAGGFSPGPGVRSLGDLPAATPLTLLVGLPSRDPSGFAAYEAAAYIPGTGAYHEFLSPTAVSSRFGPSAPEVVSVESYFAGYGLRSSVSPDGMLLTLSGTSGSVARAFGTTFDEYRGADGRTFFAHPTAARLPGSVPVSGVYGLGNVTNPQPLDLETGAGRVALAPAAGCSTGPAGLSPCQIWGAYDSAGLIANGTEGTGERIGVVDTYDSNEPQDQLESDLSDFNSIFDLPTPSVTYNYPVPTTTALNSTPTGWGTEEALDLEWTHASAPGASIAMTFAPNSGVGLYLAVDWLVSHRLVDVISLSWGEPDVGTFNAYSGACSSECNATSDGSYEILSPVLQAAAVEGIGVFVATGDCGAADGTSSVSTDYPASDPSAVAVGGTYLSVSSSGVYEGETGWSGNSSGQTAPGCQNQGGSGGGFSPFPRPYWQGGVGVPASPSTRGIPDVAADASDGVTIVQGGGAEGVGGTSLATPLWAGFAAIADQYAGRDLGLLDPTAYSILRSANYSTDFHDVTSGNNGYSAGTGWDPVTGIGTPIVGALVKDLTEPLPPDSSLRVLLYANETYGPTPTTVRFGVAPSGGQAPYPLEGVYFGDGTSGLASNGVVSHRFTRSGVYTAIAFAADSSGNLTSSYPVAIVVGGGGPLNITLTPSTGAPGVDAPVTFTASVVGGLAPYQYVYTFGDGTFLNLSSSATVTHGYGTSGGFCAAVVAEDSADPVDGARSAPVAIAVGGAPAPVCSNASEPLTVQATASPGIRDAPADFPSLFRVGGGATGEGGAGLTETLTSSDPYVNACDCAIFRAAGTYPVSLTAVDLVGDRASNETNVTVAPALTATFSTSPMYGPAPLTVTFRASEGGGYLPAPNSTEWSFGDGTRAVGAVVEHDYTTPGFYSATGDAIDGGYGNASEGFLIDVLPSGSSTAPVLTATFSPAVNISSGSTIHYSAQTSLPDGASAPAQVYWDLGENATAWGPTAAQTYYWGAPETSDFLFASVTADWTGGQAATQATLVTPQLFASETGGFVPASDALQLTASGGPPSGAPGLDWAATSGVVAPGTTNVNWSFGDGTTASGPSTNHTYLEPGNYSVNVSASDLWGDGAVAVLGVEIGSGVVPGLMVSGGPSAEGGTAPLSVTFSAAASGGMAPYTFAWATGDGGTDGTANFSHVYTLPGTYSATLTVRGASGGSVVLSWTITVVSAPHPSSSGTGSALVLYVVLAGVVVVLALAVVATRGRRRERPPSP